MATTNNIVFKWAALTVALGLAAITLIVWLVRIENRAVANTIRCDKIEIQNGEILKAIHRFDKRQLLIMHKLGVKDGDPNE